MIEIRLLKTAPTRRQGQFYQVWEVNEKKHSTIAEWGDVQFQTEDEVLIRDPEVTAHDVITLALHGHGPTEEGEVTQWEEKGLVEVLKSGGYL